MNSSPDFRSRKGLFAGAAIGAVSGLFAFGLIGSAMAPFLVGLVSDALAPRYGIESLRYGLATMIVAPLVATLLLFIAYRRLGDIAPATDRAQVTLH